MANEKGQHFSDFWLWLQTEPGQAAVAGAAGGVVRWLTLRETPLDGLAALVVGCICAIYLGPLAEPVLSSVLGFVSLGQGRDLSGLSSFVVGLGGIGFAAIVIDTVRIFRAQRFPKGDGHEE